MPKTILLRHNGDEHRVVVSDDGTVTVGEGAGLSVRPAGNGVVRIGDEHGRTAWTAADGDARWVFIDGESFRFEVVEARGRRKSSGHHGTLAAPMPATVVRVQVGPGDTVKRGDTLIILEAMKMELPVRATADGTVKRVLCRPGELVQPGVALIEIE